MGAFSNMDYFSFWSQALAAEENSEFNSEKI